MELDFTEKRPVCVHCAEGWRNPDWILILNIDLTREKKKEINFLIFTTPENVFAFATSLSHLRIRLITNSLKILRAYLCAHVEWILIKKSKLTTAVYFPMRVP